MLVRAPRIRFFRVPLYLCVLPRRIRLQRLRVLPRLLRRLPTADLVGSLPSPRAAEYGLAEQRLAERRFAAPRLHNCTPFLAGLSLQTNRQLETGGRGRALHQQAEGTARHGSSGAAAAMGAGKHKKKDQKEDRAKTCLLGMALLVALVRS